MMLIRSARVVNVLYIYSNDSFVKLSNNIDDFFSPDNYLCEEVFSEWRYIQWYIDKVCVCFEERTFFFFCYITCIHSIRALTVINQMAL